MRIYIRCSRRAALNLLRRGTDDDFARAEEIDRGNMDAARRIWSGLMTGAMDYAYSHDGPRWIVYTRSLRGPFIQASYFYTDETGNMIPTMHTDASDATRLFQTLIPGKYVNCTA